MQTPHVGNRRSPGLPLPGWKRHRNIPSVAEGADFASASLLLIASNRFFFLAARPSQTTPPSPLLSAYVARVNGLAKWMTGRSLCLRKQLTKGGSNSFLPPRNSYPAEEPSTPVFSVT
jgi:hypothetical protein